jgi:hypothetical protein
MSIGKWIVVSFILFALFIGTLVGVCVREDTSLVSSDYYNEELAYQGQIERINNTAALVDKPMIAVRENAVDIVFRKTSGIEHLDLQLFCPSNAAMDRRFRVEKIQSILSFSSDGLQRGMYRAKLRWKMNGKEYYLEEVIHI